MTNINERTDLAIRVAWLYHDRGLTQQEIADRLGISRSTISRVLTEAERDGIVRIVITQPLPEAAQLAERLIERFDLQGAIVGAILDDEPPARAAAAAVARRLESIAASGNVTIAAGWGRTIAMAAGIVRPIPTSGVLIVDAFGHTTTEDTTASVEVTNALARKFDARVLHVPSPGFAQTADLQASYLASPPISRSLERARDADYVIVSIGIVSPDSLLTAEGLITVEAAEATIDKGAVGDIFGWHFDIDGNAIPVEGLHPIALTLDDMRQSKRVIGVAGGTEKAQAVVGAIATGAIDELAVDESLAQALLDG